MNYDKLPPFSDTLGDDRLGRADMEFPLVSLIVTNYNYAEYVVEALRSVTRQTYANWECLIVDDVSTDDSRERIQAYIDEKDTPSEKFTLIKRPENGGQMRSFMDGLEASTGVFVVMLDSDDVLLEDFLETHIQHHLGNYPVAMTSSNQFQIDGDGAVVSGDHADHQSKGHLRRISMATFQRGYWIWATSSSMVFRRDTLQLILPRDGTTFEICADYYMANFANLVGDSLLIPTIHGCYRRHGCNNFGCHPVLGGINSVGDLAKHPPHDRFREAIIKHVMDHRKEFQAIFTPKGFIHFLFKVMHLSEFWKLVDENKDFFPASKWDYLKEYLRWRWARKHLKVPYLKEDVELHGPR